jgi:oxalate decarboxylase/phosphoglucose isomerase-like protein (cupin superfamily)
MPYSKFELSTNNQGTSEMIMQAWFTKDFTQYYRIMQARFY